MSIAAMNWAWAQQLTPTVKLVLMSLADAADDHGVCWPSVPTIARKCCVSTRTVRRIIGDLAASGLLRREARFRKDGSHSSNLYTLPLDGGDKLSGAPVVADNTPGRGCPHPTDRSDHPRTTSEPHKEPPRPPLAESTPIAPVAAATSAHGDDAGRDGGGHDRRLEYPHGLSEAERAEARRKLAALPVDLAQQLLDELAGRMAANAIRVTPLAYLRGLVRRACAGAFTPEAALQVAERRKRRRQTEAALRQAEAAAGKALKRVEMAAMNTSDSPLMRRLTAIRNRSRCGNGSGQ